MFTGLGEHYCTVLYCTVLYCTVLYCTVLYCTVLYCTAGCEKSRIRYFVAPETKRRCEYRRRHSQFCCSQYFISIKKTERKTSVSSFKTCFTPSDQQSFKTNKSENLTTSNINMYWNQEHYNIVTFFYLYVRNKTYK